MCVFNQVYIYIQQCSRKVHAQLKTKMTCQAEFHAVVNGQSKVSDSVTVTVSILMCSYSCIIYIDIKTYF